MLKFLGMLVLLGSTFGAGFYLGRHSLDDLRRAMGTFSRSIVETTMSVERTLRGRQSFVEAKAQIIQAKADLLDRNFGSAAKALGAAAQDLQTLKEAEQGTERAARLGALIAKTRISQQELLSGRPAVRNRLDEIQKELDALAEFSRQP